MYIHLHNEELRPSRKGPIYADRYLFAGRAAGAWSFPSKVARKTHSTGSRESGSSGLRSPGTRIFESGKHRGTTARSTIAVSAYGAVFEREPTGRGCRVLLRAAEGIRTSPDGRSKGALSER